MRRPTPTPHCPNHLRPHLSRTGKVPRHIVRGSVTLSSRLCALACGGWVALWALAGADGARARPPEDSGRADARAHAAEVHVENPPLFPLSDVRRGLEGIGYTVFESASGPESFGVHVLGVLRSYLGPGEDLIIARLSGARIEKTGVISGMSGSPVYVEGRLLGAVGYRFGSFTAEPIAGITPIERMLAVAPPPPDDSLEAHVHGAAPGSEALRISAASGPMRRRLPETAWGVAEPIAVPVATGGLHPAVADAFGPLFRERGYGPLVPAAGASPAGSAAGGTLPAPSAGRLFAAGPVAGVLVSGDVLMAGIGTVTWVNGPRFLAFGHPFLGIGASEMPVFDAEIITTVASQAGSWKMGQALQPVGRLTDDRLHAIGGTLGLEARTMPMSVHLETPGPRAAANARDRLQFRVLRHPADTPLFAAMALANALTSRIGVERSGTLTVEGTVQTTAGDTLTFRRRSASDGGALEIVAAMAVLDELERIANNGLRDVAFRDVHLRVRREREVRAESVVGVRALSPLSPGGDARVRVDLQRWEGAADELQLTVHVPRGLAPGRYSLIAAGPAAAGRLEAEGGLRGGALTFASWLAARRQHAVDGEISLYLVSDEAGLALQGEALPATPASLWDVLGQGGGAQGDVLEKRVVRVARIDTGGVVSGSVKARIELADIREGRRD